MLARLQGLALRARLVVEGYVAGVHRSPFHGFSIEFAEHREYAPGDDLRYLDWKVFGRTDKFYLKQFEEETNLVCYLLLDTSESMAYQSAAAPMSKLEYAQCAAAALAYLVLQQQDSVGLVTFDREIRALVRPSSNPSHLKQMLHVMEQSPGRAEDGHRPDLPRPGRAVQEAGHRDHPQRPVRRRRRDDGRPEALSPSPARGDRVARARSGRARFSLRADDAVPRPGGLPEVLAEPRALRKAYLAELQKFLHRLKQGCRLQRIDYVLVRTDQSLEVVLVELLGIEEDERASMFPRRFSPSDSKACRCSAGWRRRLRRG